MNQSDWAAPAYPPPAWVFRILSLPLTASMAEYQEAFERQISPLRYKDDSEIFRDLVAEKQRKEPKLSYEAAWRIVGMENLALKKAMNAPR